MADRTRPPGRFGAGSLVLLLLLAVATLAIVLPTTVWSFNPDPSLQQADWTEFATQRAPEFAAGDFENVALTPDGLQLGSDDSFKDSEDVPTRFGVFTSSVVEAQAPFSAVRVDYDATGSNGNDLEVEVRVMAAGRWSQWESVATGGQAFSSPASATAAQYRATITVPGGDASPTLTSVHMQAVAAPEGEAQYQAMETRPTLRLYGTREGLVGNITSNGHRIVEKDRFVALPSKKALNPKDGRDYQVEISYKGKKATVPVWDVGPWNSKDDYWNAPREIFNDIPRFTPQVNAAFFNNHNNGNDQYGRPVLYPASIDIADGTFLDDLGMKTGDWVDVTFLWLDAAAPPLVPMPVVVPKPGPAPKPIFQQTAQAAPAAPAAPTAPPAPPTPTPIPKTWYFAEGSTNKPFDTWLLLQNPDPEPANVKVTYMLPKGGQQVGYYLLKPTSRTSLFLNSIVPNTDVSALVEADRYILAERAMYFGQEGHDTAGVISPSKTWYFAEGSTKPTFDTWVLMQNPNTVPANVTLTFYKDDGTIVTHKMLVPHVSRESLLVNLVVPDANLGVKIEADQPIIAERAVYKDRKAGADSMGATALSTTWYLAEGNTRDDFDTWLLMMNPNDSAATVTVSYLREDADRVVKTYTVPPHARQSVLVDQEVPNARVGAKIESSVPIVAERSVYFSGGAASHNSVAAPQLSKLWYLPEGSTAKPFRENVLLANPGDQPANVTVTFMKEDGSSVDKQYTLKPFSRFTVEANNVLPDTAFSTKVSSDQPIVAERSMYFSDWMGGHNAMGIPK